MDNDWTEVRYELDVSENFGAISNSPWYSDAVYPRFSDAEFARRHAHARRLMEREAVDALILTGSPNIYSMGAGVTWASGLIDDRAMCQYMVLLRQGEPVLIYPHPGCHIEAARKMVSISDVRSGRHGRYGEAIGEVLKEAGVTTGRIGVTAADRTGPEFMGADVFADLRRRFPDASFVFLPELMHELTLIKSSEEIEAQRRAGQLVVDAMHAVEQHAAPGVTEASLAAAATAAILEGEGRVHLMMIGSTSTHDPRAIFPNPFPSGRKLSNGDIILSEIAATYMGYSAKVGHPIVVGEPAPGVAEFFSDVVVAGFRRIVSTLKDGASLEEVREATGHFRQVGAQSRPIVMHGIDLITSPPYVHTDKVRSSEIDSVLRTGMTVNVEITPINAEGTFGIFFSRTFAITDDGVDELTPLPLDGLIVAKGSS
jgi:Xaa-Pro aminopeptidase